MYLDYNSLVRKKEVVETQLHKSYHGLISYGLDYGKNNLSNNLKTSQFLLYNFINKQSLFRYQSKNSITSAFEYICIVWIMLFNGDFNVWLCLIAKKVRNNVRVL